MKREIIIAKTVKKLEHPRILTPDRPEMELIEKIRKIKDPRKLVHDAGEIFLKIKDQKKINDLFFLIKDAGVFKEHFKSHKEMEMAWRFLKKKFFSGDFLFLN